MQFRVWISYLDDIDNEGENDLIWFEGPQTSFFIDFQQRKGSGSYGCWYCRVARGYWLILRLPTQLAII